EAEGPLKPGLKEIKVADKRDKARTAETYLLSDEVYEELLATTLRRGDKLTLLCVPDSNNNLIAVKVLSAGDAQPLFHDDITVRVNTRPIDLSDDAAVEHSYVLYNGPLKVMLLGQMR